jgi:hypothetical protein
MGFNIGEVYQSSSDFLKADDIGTNMWTVTIKDIGMKDFDDGSRKLLVQFVELDKGLVLNKTNADTIGALYGTNTDGWINRQVMLMTMPVDYQGKKVNAIRVRAPAQQQAMPQRTSPNAPLNGPQPALNGPQPARQFDDRNPPPIADSDIPF